MSIGRTVINDLVSAPHWMATRTAAVAARKRLERDGQTGPISRALSRYLGFTKQSRSVFGDIERVRRSHERSTDVIRYTDYGAGQVNDLSTNEQNFVTRSKSEISKSSAPAHECRLLYSLVAELQPRVGIELGTCLGISSAYQALALSENGSGQLYTIEGGEQLVMQAQTTHRQLGVANVEIICGVFATELPGLLERLGQVDYAFVDGHHNGQATVEYFDMLKPFLSTGAVVVFDDLSWSADMKQAWRKISTNPKIDYAVDLYTIGICVTN